MDGKEIAVKKYVVKLSATGSRLMKCAPCSTPVGRKGGGYRFEQPMLLDFYRGPKDRDRL